MIVNSPVFKFLEGNFEWFPVFYKLAGAEGGRGVTLLKNRPIIAGFVQEMWSECSVELCNQLYVFRVNWKGH